jgi:plasmid stability protein
MSTLQINLPDDLKARIDARAAECGFSSPEAYAESLLRADAEDQVIDDDLEELLLKRLDSGPSILLTPALIEQLKQEVAEIRRSGKSTS